MAATRYDRRLSRLLMDEGGYTNHPSDPGGPTNFGITICDYRKYVKPSATASDVRAMKVEEAKSIYRAKYWDRAFFTGASSPCAVMRRCRALNWRPTSHTVIGRV